MRRAVASRKAPLLLSRQQLRIDGRSVEVSLRLNPRARRLIVKVNPSTGEVSVTAPSRAGLGRALEFARGEEKWIARQLSHVPAHVALEPGARVPFRGTEHVVEMGEKGPAPVWIDTGARHIRVSGRAEHAARRICDFLKKECRGAVETRVVEYALALGVKPSRICLRDTASRWGSCSAARALSFSWRLILAPDFVLDYVVAHEVAHLREMNHGARFWRHVEGLVGNPKAAQAWLREHGTSLQRYAPAKS